ncbi:MAG TPA: hypothetical protein DCM08_11020 [Microscillaceae bacterium]|jgi:hypothetical protein|nr:hypothetical protein [Microscillaceae bacterium]
MKKLPVLLLLLFPVCVALISCGNETNTMLSRKWKVKQLELPQMQEILGKIEKQEDKEQFKNDVSSLIEKSVFDFKPNGKYEITLIVKDSVKITKGEWSIEDKDKSKKIYLVATEEKTKAVSRFLIKTIQADKLLLEEQNGNKASLLLVPMQ